MSPALAPFVCGRSLREAGRSEQAHAAKPWSHVGCCHPSPLSQRRCNRPAYRCGIARGWYHGQATLSPILITIRLPSKLPPSHLPTSTHSAPPCPALDAPNVPLWLHLGGISNAIHVARHHVSCAHFPPAGVACVAPAKPISTPHACESCPRVRNEPTKGPK